jgi:hypothetical protein
VLHVSVEDERVKDVKEAWSISVPESRFAPEVSLSSVALIRRLLPFDEIVRLISSAQGIVLGL